MAKPLRAFVDIPDVQEHLDRAAQMVGRHAEDRFFEMTQMYMRHVTTPFCDSPLEAIFLIWWHACEVADLKMKDEFALYPQHEVTVCGELFRLDFVVEPYVDWIQQGIAAGVLPWHPIAIELDGHAFHERTREQVALRDRRDRLLQQDRWRVFHFSWSEFTTEPERCVREVWDILSDLRNQYRETLKQGVITP